jgi:phosphatidylglycerophosphatase A
MSPLIKLRRQSNSKSDIEVSFLAKLFASGLFTGYVPIASGTIGSLLAVGLYCIPGFEEPITLAIIILATLVIGTRTAGIMEKRYGHDPAEMTIDEIAGMWISLFLLPKRIYVIAATFFIFRILDIIKPFPARKFDRMNGGFGIMMDDVVSGIYANIIIQIALYISPLNEVLLK